MKRIKTIIGMFLIAIFAFNLGGCTNTKIGRAIVADQAKTDLIGKTRNEVISCAGVPVRSLKNKEFNSEFFTYVGGSSSSFSLHRINSIMNPIFAKSKNRSCTVTIELVNNIVTKVRYSGDTGPLLAPDELCAEVVADCVK